MDLNNGDSAYCVFDVDYNSEEVINKILADAKKKNIHVILSKPCFEVFYILHFGGDIDCLAIPRDVKEEMCRYITEYSETRDYWNVLLPHQSKALKLSRRFSLDDAIDLKRCLNGSNIHEFFDEIARKKGVL